MRENENLNQLLDEAFDHLKGNRHHLGLKAAQKVFEADPDNARAAACLAWAYLETGKPNKTLEYADLGVTLAGNDPLPYLYRGYLLMRLGIYDNAIADLDHVIGNDGEDVGWACELKAKALAGMGEFKNAYETYERAVKIDPALHHNFPKLRGWYKKAASSGGSFLNKLLDSEKDLVLEAEEALNVKEYWYALWASRKVLRNDKLLEHHPKAIVIELETMYALFQYMPALKKAEKIKEIFEGNERFQTIYKKLVAIQKRKEAADRELANINRPEAPPQPPKVSEEQETVEEETPLQKPPAERPPAFSKLEPESFEIDDPDIPSPQDEEELIIEEPEPHSEEPLSIEEPVYPEDTVLQEPEMEPDEEEDEPEPLLPADEIATEDEIPAEPDSVQQPVIEEEPPAENESPEATPPLEEETEKPTAKPEEPAKEEQPAPSAAIESDKKAAAETQKPSRRTDFEAVEGAAITAHYAATFDLLKNARKKKKQYTLQFDYRKIRYIAVEVIISNPFYGKTDETLEGEVVWYVNEKEVGRSDVEIDVKGDWKYAFFVQSWGADTPGFWHKGQGRADIHLNGEKICERWFLVDTATILNFEEFDIDEVEAQEEEIEMREIAAAQKSESLEELLKHLDSLTGLEAVKTGMHDFVDFLKFIKERKKLGLKGEDSLSMNVVFLGNPGTGKTMVARLLGKIFKAMGLLEKGQLVETDRAGLVGQYVGETAQKTEEIITSAMGGLLFIDEAYTLSKKSGSSQDFGQEAIDTLLKRMEDKSGQFAVIVAGYPDEMNGFLESNPGMKSRFNHFFNFEDYSPDEMISIFTMMAEKQDYSVAEEALDLLKKEFTKLYRGRDKTFGNARLVRNLFDDAKMQLGKRYLKLPDEKRTKDALTTITIEDIAAVFKDSSKDQYKVGIDEESLKKHLDKLNKLTGLDSVKREISEMVKLARYFVENGDDVQSRFSDHVVFLGNPGTGKTTVARIFSGIYSALGILPKGHLIEADRQKLVAGYVGKTAEQTTQVIDEAMGGTLFIDEAYALVKSKDSGSDFGAEAIDTLLKRMEDDRGKFITIAAGYTNEMKQFLASNPGLESRFTKFITFEDYTPDELMVIARRLLEDKELKLSEECEKQLLKRFNELYRGRDKTFSNARLVRNIVEGAVKQQMLRLVDVPQSERTAEMKTTVQLEDVQELRKETKKKSAVTGDKELLEAHLEELKSLSGLDAVKGSVEKLISSLKVAKLRESRGMKVMRKNLHASFLGNPGTGKTTVARLLSKIFKEMGLLEKGHLVEVDRSALVAGYQGQTAKKTEDIIQSALDGTLFIDEAYTLSRGQNDFGQEAIDTLLKRMEDYKDRLVVIVAGYPNEMHQFLDSNPGLSSRFSNSFMFEDYNPDQMIEIAATIADKNGYILGEGVKEALEAFFKQLYEQRDKNFGNARAVRNVLYKAISFQEERILILESPSDDDLMTISVDDVEQLNSKEFI